MELKTYFAQDASGNIIPNAQVFVYLAGTTTLASGIVDQNGAPLTNPFNADIRAAVVFAAPDGEYDVKCSGASRTVTIRAQLFDGGAFKADLASTAAGKGAGLVGFKQSATGAVGRTVNDKLGEVVSVKDFGAVGDGVTDDTAAVQAALDAVPAGSVLVFPRGRYMVGALTRTGALTIQGEGGGKTQIAQIGGLTVNNSGELRNASFRAFGVTFLARSTDTVVSVGVTGVSHGGGESLEVAFEDCQWSGMDRADGTGFDFGFLECVSATTCSGVFFERCFGIGPEHVVSADFAAETAFVKTTSCNHLHVSKTHIYFFKKGVRPLGRQESHRITDSLIVACVHGVHARYSSYVADNIIQSTHISAFDGCIDVDDDGTVAVEAFTPMVDKCSLYKRQASVAAPFIYIKMKAQGGLISNNVFYPESTNSFTAQDIAVYFPEGARNRVLGNYFHFPWKCLQVGSSANVTNFVGNTIYDRAETLAAPIAAADVGTPNVVMVGNSTDRDGSVAYAKVNAPRLQISTPSGIAAYFEHGGPGAASANYFRIFSHAVGNSPGIQAEGSDADIDIRLIPKGIGKVRMGTRVASADAPITGYIEIKDAGGTLRRLAVIG